VNSESKLVQELGKVVKASDLSDYSDHFTLGSKSLEEFEGFLKKHESKGKRIIYASDSDGSSVLYSLDPSTGHKQKESKLDSDSGIITYNQKLRTDPSRTDFRPSALQQCFCAGDDISIQGSYGGLRDDEILIANCSSISTKNTMDRPPQRVESQEDNYDSHSEEERDDQEASKSSESGSSESEGNGVWGISFPWIQGNNSSDEEESEHDQSTIPPVVSFVSSAPSRSVVSVSPSKSVTWEQSNTIDSVEESMEESRAEAIAKKARADNILSMFKKTPLDEQIDMTQVEEEMDDTEEVSRHSETVEMSATSVVEMNHLNENTDIVQTSHMVFMRMGK
jgi:hypothetical protein